MIHSIDASKNLANCQLWQQLTKILITSLITLLQSISIVSLWTRLKMPVLPNQAWHSVKLW